MEDAHVACDAAAAVAGHGHLCQQLSFYAVYDATRGRRHRRIVSCTCIVMMTRLAERIRRGRENGEGG